MGEERLTGLALLNTHRDISIDVEKIIDRLAAAIRLIKNNLRSSIADDRLDSLMILSVEKDVVDQLDMNKIATLWATLKNRRINI
ncbi:unnamed protein product [Macrosiphum euphorbiae]|uniref:Uncharacterized protein n=1 Tax=Macrosiphum euphorbiae TaxID=13131 RepID=A0AAV0XQ35_9HEMI|nr:unnamed protein product [Macrosiphum euphorbiae]